MRKLLGACAAALIAALALACAPPVSTTFPTPVPSARPIGTLTLSAETCTLDGLPAEIRTGPSSLTVVNRLSGMGIADFVQITGETTYQDFAADIQVAIDAAVAGKEMVPRPSYLLSTAIRLSAGGSTSQRMTLGAGTYGVVCLRTYEALGEIRPYAIAGPIEVR